MEPHCDQPALGGFVMSLIPARCIAGPGQHRCGDAPGTSASIHARSSRNHARLSPNDHFAMVRAAAGPHNFMASYVAGPVRHAA